MEMNFYHFLTQNSSCRSEGSEVLGGGNGLQCCGGLAKESAIGIKTLSRDDPRKCVLIRNPLRLVFV